MTAQDILNLQVQLTKKMEPLRSALLKKAAVEPKDWQEIETLAVLDASFWLSEVALQLARVNEAKVKAGSKTLWQTFFGSR